MSLTHHSTIQLQNQNGPTAQKLHSNQDESIHQDNQLKLKSERKNLLP